MTVTARRVQLSTAGGKILVEFKAAPRQALEAWLAAERFNFDCLQRIKGKAQDGRVPPV